MPPIPHIWIHSTGVLVRLGQNAVRVRGSTRRRCSNLAPPFPRLRARRLHGRVVRASRRSSTSARQLRPTRLEWAVTRSPPAARACRLNAVLRRRRGRARGRPGLGLATAAVPAWLAAGGEDGGPEQPAAPSFVRGRGRSAGSRRGPGRPFSGPRRIGDELIWGALLEGLRHPVESAGGCYLWRFLVPECCTTTLHPNPSDVLSSPLAGKAVHVGGGP